VLSVTRMLWTVSFTIVLAACKTTASEDPVPGAAATVSQVPEVSRTYVFDCRDGVSFTVRTGPGEVAIRAPASLGGQLVVAAQTRSASGARYQAGDTVFWNKGDKALFEFGGQTYVDCRSNPAKVP
jgi:membrane-bound inhibitor of C-type lysozyme